MMTFSDDDLKRLKEICNEKIPESGFCIARYSLKALLTRLEAAEQVVSLAIQYTLIVDEVVPIGDAVEAWQKVAGK